MSFLLRYRRVFVVLLHLGLVALANWAAFVLRFEGDIAPDHWLAFVECLPWLIAIRALTFPVFRLYEGLWRYTSVTDAVHIVNAVGTSSGIFFVLVRLFWGAVEYPRSVFVIDAILLIFLMGSVRLSRRLHRQLSRLGGEKRVLIYGAGDAGEMIVRDMKNNSFYGYDPVGFVDDDPRKVGKRIHGVRVLGTRSDLARIVVDRDPDEIVVAMPRATPAVLREVLKTLEPFRLPIRTLPNLRDVLNGTVTVSQIRTLAVEDLLERPPVGLEVAPLRQLVGGRRVLITGAGGSIGSELCRQIAALNPSAMVAMDRYENGLHALMLQLGTNGQNGHDDGFSIVVADVTDDAALQGVFERYRPQVVFHAAAHKHVPLMEMNPCEAVKNNVRGARMLVQTAGRFGVERLVLISTDKAVNPVSVMGATKRVAELLVLARHDDATIFSAVRFGNVLASNGSVVPRFMDQIKAGGPVTITHPDMRRYFMLIPEAVQLVLHAATLAEGHDMFLLEMGEPVRIVDLAHNLIRLSGRAPGDDVQIQFTGLRPGERLDEDLVGDDEVAAPSEIAGVRRVRSRTRPDRKTLVDQVLELEGLAIEGDAQAVIKRLSEIVPTYRPYEMQR